MYPGSGHFFKYFLADTSSSLSTMFGEIPRSFVAHSDKGRYQFDTDTASVVGSTAFGSQWMFDVIGHFVGQREF